MGRSIVNPITEVANSTLLVVPTAAALGVGATGVIQPEYERRRQMRAGLATELAVLNGVVNVQSLERKT